MRDDNIGWEYHQDERDKAAAAGAVVLLGCGTLLLVVTVVCVFVVAMAFCK